MIVERIITSDPNIRWFVSLRYGLFVERVDNTPNEPDLSVVDVWGFGYHNLFGWLFGHVCEAI